MFGRGSKKDTHTSDNFVAVSGPWVGILARSSYTIFMQKFEVGVLCWSAGNFFPYEVCNFLSIKETFLKIQTMIKSRSNVSSSLSNKLIKRQSLRASRGEREREGGGDWKII